nr:MAG TPA: protein of unknown function DUF4314 [Caudoviricetes sp.]
MSILGNAVKFLSKEFYYTIRYHVNWDNGIG